MKQPTERTSLVLSDALSILQGMVRALDAHERSLRLSGEIDAPHRMAAVSEVRREMAAAADSARDVLAHLPAVALPPALEKPRPPARHERRDSDDRRGMEARVATERRRLARRMSAERRIAPPLILVPSEPVRRG